MRQRSVFPLRPTKLLLQRGESRSQLVHEPAPLVGVESAELAGLQRRERSAVMPDRSGSLRRHARRRSRCAPTCMEGQTAHLDRSFMMRIAHKPGASLEPFSDLPRPCP